MADKVSETVVINRVMRELEKLPTARARLRCFTYVIERLREAELAELAQPLGMPPQPDRQQGLPHVGPAPDPFGDLS